MFDTDLDSELNRLIAAARACEPMTPAEVREQRISFAYGQLVDSQPDITRESVAIMHDEMFHAS